MLSLEQETAVWDSVLLEPLTEDHFVTNLSQRFKRDRIYTYIGTDLISINPYKKLSIYSTESIGAYMSRGPFNLPPHVYAVASTAYRWLRDKNENQSIIISGESGSGKTEVSRIVTQFLVLASPGASNCIQQVKDRLVHAGQLLESFGNAKTLLNDNASRFGKFLDIELDFKGDPIGGHIIHFMLEKSRITSLTPGDTNFHCFYQLLGGADITFLKSLKLKRNINNYSILNKNENNCATIQNPNGGCEKDKAHFNFTKTSMEILGFSSAETLNVFQMIAIILKLSNLIFLPSSNIDGTEGCVISNEYELYEICDIINCEIDSFRKMLTTKTHQESGVQLELTATEAAKRRDNICANLYNRLFTWLVNRVNDSLKAKSYGKHRMLGILDIYGFEKFDKNGLETLLINYANEVLNNTIVKFTLGYEQEEYIHEGLEWTKIDYFDNFIICDLIDKKNHGIFSSLEEPQITNNELFYSRLKQCCAGHTHCSFASTTSSSTTSTTTSLDLLNFIIHHFAGPVNYNVENFLEKNNDHISRDISQSLYNSTHDLLKQLYPEGNPLRGSIIKKLVPVTVQFKMAIDTLQKTLMARNAHFIRCIKPNENKLARIFDLSLVQHQVRYLNLMEMTQLRRNGFSYRMPYSKFLIRYRMLSCHTWPRWPLSGCLSDSSTPVEITLRLVRTLPLPIAEFSFGRTKLFIRSPRTMFELESFRSNRLHYLATLIQTKWRGYHQRKKYLRITRSAMIIGAAWRSWRDCKLGVPYENRKHLWDIYSVAQHEVRLIKYKKQVEWAVKIIQRRYIQWKRRQFLLKLPETLPPNIESPICDEWPQVKSFRLQETNRLLCIIHHKWRCHKYRLKFDQIARNRMREKVTASLIFKNRKASYPKSVSHPFCGDYVRLRQNIQWKKLCIETNDQYVVFADIINKITRSSGKFVPILLVVSTSAMLILDQRTLQIKYRVPANEIYRLSLSPYLDDIAVFHIRASMPNAEDNHILTFSASCTGSYNPSYSSNDHSLFYEYDNDDDSSKTTGCLFQSDLAKKKGDFIFQTSHIIEIVTKLFLVIQNAIGKAPEINISTEFEANFGQQTVVVAFRCIGLPEVQPGHIRVIRKGDRMDILL